MEDNPQDKIGKLRASIDEIDAALVHLLAERFRLTDRVGRVKAMHKLPAVDSKREEAQFERLRDIANDAGLDAQVAVRLLKQVIQEVVQRHLETANATRVE